MQYGNYGTGFIGLYLSDEAFAALENDAHFTAVTEYLIKTAGGAELSTMKNAVSKLFRDKEIPTLSLTDRETTKDSRTMVAGTIVLFLAVVALLVLIVSIFLARFKIKNTIDEEISEMGVPKGIDNAFTLSLDGRECAYTVSVSNAAKETESMQMMYASLIMIVAIALFVITVLIILLILYLILRSMITSLKTDFGIYKAVGFTSRQLVVQTVGSITPVVLLGALLSALLGLFYLPAMFDGIFSVLGSMKNNFEIPPHTLLSMAVILTAVNMLIGMILCRPIKRITAYSLIKE